MKTKQIRKDNQPVTSAQFKIAMAKIDKRFEKIDERFEKADKRTDGLEAEMRQGFKIMNAKLAAFIAILNANIDRAIRESEARQDKKFQKIFDAIDAFIKRTESSEREILFLGKQHDDLANYCTEKIGYPVYGR